MTSMASGSPISANHTAVHPILAGAGCLRLAARSAQEARRRQRLRARLAQRRCSRFVSPSCPLTSTAVCPVLLAGAVRWPRRLSADFARGHITCISGRDAVPRRCRRPPSDLSPATGASPQAGGAPFIRLSRDASGCSSRARSKGSAYMPSTFCPVGQKTSSALPSGSRR